MLPDAVPLAADAADDAVSALSAAASEEAVLVSLCVPEAVVSVPLEAAEEPAVVSAVLEEAVASVSEEVLLAADGSSYGVRSLL